MSVFQILLLVFMSLILLSLITFVVCVILKIRKDSKKAAILSHRELWLYYLDNPELENLLSNNNGKDVKNLPNPDDLSEKQYRFLVLFLNHMETMLPSWKKYKKDWLGLFKNPCLRKVYDNTKLYRNKRFCRLIDSIIDSYDK